MVCRVGYLSTNVEGMYNIAAARRGDSLCCSAR